MPQPIVTGVTSLGIDHIFVLGKTLPEIAGQKGGIYKARTFLCVSACRILTLLTDDQPGVPALAVDQPAEGLDVLRSRAAELGASSFTVVPENSEIHSIPLGASIYVSAASLVSADSCTLGLAGVHQRTNASLAVGLVQAFLASPRLPPAFASHALPPSTASSLPVSLVAPSPLPREIVGGLVQTRWPGRCQIERDTKVEGLTWYLDGAHTVESLKCCGDWFGDVALSRFVLSPLSLVLSQH